MTGAVYDYDPVERRQRRSSAATTQLFNGNTTRGSSAFTVTGEWHFRPGTGCCGSTPFASANTQRSRCISSSAARPRIPSSGGRPPRSRSREFCTTAPANPAIDKQVEQARRRAGRHARLHHRDSRNAGGTTMTSAQIVDTLPVGRHVHQRDAERLGGQRRRRRPASSAPSTCARATPRQRPGHRRPVGHARHQRLRDAAVHRRTDTLTDTASR